MKRSIIIVIALTALVFQSASLSRQTKPNDKAKYLLASKFSPNKMKKMVFSTSVDPHWLKLSDRFWYSFETSEGKTFYIVDPVKRTKRPIFDNVKIAAMLTRITKDPYDAKHLPIDKIKFIKNETAIFFEVESSQDEKKEEKEEKEEKKEDQKKEEKKDDKKKVKNKKPKKKIFFFEYRLSTGKLTIVEDYKKPKKRPDWASIAPDSSVVIFSKNYNLFWMDMENYLKAVESEEDSTKEDSTIVEHPLTTDGEEYYSYQGRSRGETNVDKVKNKDKRKSVRIVWSRNSKKFAMTRSDSREVKDLWVINSVANPRPTLET